MSKLESKVRQVYAVAILYNNSAVPLQRFDTIEELNAGYKDWRENNFEYADLYPVELLDEEGESYLILEDILVQPQLN